MKAGTTTLFKLLCRHPSICTSHTKESEFFSEVQDHKIEINNYESLFEYDKNIHSKCLEASTGYSKFPMEVDVPSRMKEYGIDPLFIYAVRDPIERIQSEFNFCHLKNNNFAKDDITNLRFVFNSMYHLQLREFTNIFPDHRRYFIADFEEIVTKPVQIAKRIFKWAELSDYEPKVPRPQNVTPNLSKIERKLKGLPFQWRKFILEMLRKPAIKLLRQNDVSAKKKLPEYQRKKLRSLLRMDMLRFKDTFCFNTQKCGF